MYERTTAVAAPEVFSVARATGITRFGRGVAVATGFDVGGVTITGFGVAGLEVAGAAVTMARSVLCGRGEDGCVADGCGDGVGDA